MKSDIILNSTVQMSREDWLAFRMRGIGASEVGVIFGLSPYKASIQLFYEKIGDHPKFDLQSLPAFLGKNQESFIAEMWTYWGGDVAGMMHNFETGTQVRKMKRVNAYAQNKKYPHLFVSLDREINKYDDRGNGALELKTIGGYEADKWESGLPPGYVMQVQTQMMVMEYKFGEIAILKDNRDFSVLPFDINADICESIQQVTTQFWAKVVKAREIMTARFEADRTFNGRMVDQLTADIQALEPEPDGSDAFNNFLKEKYQIAVPGERLGTPAQLEQAQKGKALNDQIKTMEAEQQMYYQLLKNDLGHAGADKLDFGKEGYVSWKANAKGSRVFLNKVR